MKKHLAHHQVEKLIRPAFKRLDPVEQYAVPARPHYRRIASRVTKHTFKTRAWASSTASGPGAAPRKDFYRAAFRKIIARTALKEA